MSFEELKKSGMPYVMKITKKRYNPFCEEDRLRMQMGEYFGVEHSPCAELRVNNNGCVVVLYEACRTRRRDPMQFPEDWKGENSDADNWCFGRCFFPLDVSVFDDDQWETYLQKRPPEGKKLDYSVHPENEKIFLEKYPEILELIKDEQVKEALIVTA
jgi:hypothetical protein